MIRWVVRPGDGERVGELVARAGGDPAAIADGRVFVGRRRALAADERVDVGAEIAISPPRRDVTATSTAATTTDAGATADAGASGGPKIVVLARAGDVVAIAKPAGIPTIADHGGAAGSAQALLAAELGVARERAHPTSRLDRDVSGVVVFALSPHAAEHLARAREAGAYDRRYVAIATATRALDPTVGTWDAPIGRAKDPRHRQAFGRDATDARSLYAVVARAGEAATSAVLLALAPITGRTHQLRVHAAHAGAPLLGDRTYADRASATRGGARIGLPSGRVLALPRIALHCARVVVPSPTDPAKSLTIDAPIPPELHDLWTALGGDAAAWNTAVTCVLRS